MSLNSSFGLIRCLASNEDATLVSAAYSSGVVATIDLRNGQILSTWKPHDGEVCWLSIFFVYSFSCLNLFLYLCVLLLFFLIFNLWNLKTNLNSFLRLVACVTGRGKIRNGVIRKRRLCWFGHFARMDANCMTERNFSAYVDDREPREGSWCSSGYMVSWGLWVKEALVWKVREAGRN